MSHDFTFAGGQSTKTCMEHHDLLQRATSAGRGRSIFRLACQRHLEGIVCKRADPPYRSGRTSDWMKTKCTYGRSS